MKCKKIAKGEPVDFSNNIVLKLYGVSLFDNFIIRIMIDIGEQKGKNSLIN
jgi:hypothetical protein